MLGSDDQLFSLVGDEELFLEGLLFSLVSQEPQQG
jgi:hypothetical protein